MRMTNKIMRNNSIYNINQNKITEDKLNTQMTNQSKINRPSDDPVVAIRALRLRTNVSTVSQYYDKNAEDADSWLKLTGDAMDTVGDILTDLYKQAMDSSKKSYTYQDLDVVLTQMKSLTKEFYSSANVDYAGRYIFSGYRTDTPVTFTQEDINEFTKDPDNLTTFVMEETLGYKDITSISYTDWKSAVDKTNGQNETDVTNTTLYRFRLSYDQLGMTVEDGEDISESDIQLYFTLAGEPQTVKAYKEAEDAYEAVLSGECDMAYIPSTGELVFSEDYYSDPTKITENMSLRVKYSKSDWSEGDINPVHYFHAVKCSQNSIEDAMQLEAAENTLNASQNALSKAESALETLSDIRMQLAEMDGSDTAKLGEAIKTAQKAAKNLLDAAQTEADLAELTAGMDTTTLTDEEAAVVNALDEALAVYNALSALDPYNVTAADRNTALAAVRTAVQTAAPDTIAAAKQQTEDYQIEVNRIRNLITEYNASGQDQDVYYNVGFNQTIQVNTHAKEIFTHDVQRDIDDFEIYLKQLQDVESAISDLETERDKYAEDSDEYKALQLKIDAAEKAYTYIRDNVQTKFENQISKYQSYIDTTNVAVTNNGTRQSRLALIQTRLMNQKATFKDLQSNNEDVDMSEVAVQLKSAELTYEASLMATSKIMQTNLMNYI
ncbi:MAG: hypothetical protein HDR03_15700 [Lachnospiraceae bacterium]|nr:hypothetical protein [Lachnospiraceae bacterium]